MQITHRRQRRRPQPEQIVAGECCEGWELSAAPFIVCAYVCVCVCQCVSLWRLAVQREGGGVALRRSNQMCEHGEANRRSN